MLTPKENLIILGCATAAAVVVIPTGCLKGGASVSYFIARVMLFFFSENKHHRARRSSLHHHILYRRVYRKKNLCDKFISMAPAYVIPLSLFFFFWLKTNLYTYYK